MHKYIAKKLIILTLKIWIKHLLCYNINKHYFEVCI